MTSKHFVHGRNVKCTWYLCTMFINYMGRRLSHRRAMHNMAVSLARTPTEAVTCARRVVNNYRLACLPHHIMPGQHLKRSKQPQLLTAHLEYRIRIWMRVITSVLILRLPVSFSPDHCQKLISIIKHIVQILGRWCALFGQWGKHNFGSCRPAYTIMHSPRNPVWNCYRSVGNGSFTHTTLPQ